MPLPPRTQTNTRGSQATKVDLEKGVVEQNLQKSQASGLTASAAAKGKAPAEESQLRPPSIDDDPATAPQECTLEEALAAAYLYPQTAVLAATGTDAEAGLKSGEVKKRQASIAMVPVLPPELHR